MKKTFFIAVLLVLSLEAGACLAVPYDFFFVVHCEAMKEDAVDSSFQMGLAPLVRLAEKYGIRLTISLSPQWAEYVSESVERKSTLAAWVRRGHEIGVLHYGLNHKPTWDYYTNETDPLKIMSAGRDPALRKGSMHDLVNKINYLLASDPINGPAAKQISMSAADYDADLVPGLQLEYLTDGSYISNDFQNQDVARRPIRQMVNGVRWWKLSMGYFAIVTNRFSRGYIVAQLRKIGLSRITSLWPAGCSENKQLSDIKDLYLILKNPLLIRDFKDYKLGIVTHPLDFIGDDFQSGGCGYIEELLSFVNERIKEGAMSSKTVSGVLANTR